MGSVETDSAGASGTGFSVLIGISAVYRAVGRKVNEHNASIIIIGENLKI
jgi:transcriptional regulator of nitric oxide reductase